MDEALQALDRRLQRGVGAPLIVALSGGSDSLALLLLTQRWTRRHGRAILAVTVDHQLQPRSAAWTRAAAAAATRLGAAHRAVAWDGDKPRAGLPAAARSARHRLLAQVAREVGASVILFGHTQDDLREGVLMRGAGSTVGPPAEWSPSPVWPQGRGTFHLRPLLGARRSDLREMLAAEGMSWIDDPANDDPRYARARARAALASGAVAEARPGLLPDGLAALAEACVAEPWGGLRIDRRVLAAAPPAAAARVLQTALTCVGGGEAPPRGDRVRALLSRLAGDQPLTASMAGARVEATDQVAIMREAGETGRGGMEGFALGQGAEQVWDGRFELSAVQPGWSVRPLAGAAGRIGRSEHALLKGLPAGARGALPLLIHEDADATCPVLAGSAALACRSLVAGRFRAACGAIAREG